MALHKSTQVTARVPIPSADGATGLIFSVADFVVPASGFASADVCEMGAIPAGYVPVDLIVDNADLGTTVTADWGILSGSYGDPATRTCGAEFIAASALGTASVLRMSVVGGGRVAPTTGDRSWGFVASTVSAATSGAVMRATLVLRPQSEGV